jgi:heterodisulfide reductase subunit B
MVPCAACFNRLKMAEHQLGQDTALKAEIEDVVGGRYQGSAAIRNPIDIIANDVGLEALSAKVVNKLKGLKPVSYYGCLLLRPPEVCNFDNAENPVLLDKIMEALGAEARPWSFKTDCCGGSLTISKTAIVTKMVDKLMAMAREAGANCLVTACPICTANLDMRASAGKELPVFYFTELAALAMGQDAEGWFKLHRTDPRPLLRGLGLL